MEKQKPSIGRVVHYFNTNGEPQAALVIAVHTEETVSLVYWNSGGTQSSAYSVPLGEGAGRWNWPARV